MRFTTKTEYGLICLIYMAKQGRLTPVTVKQIVTEERFPSAFTEKILQALRQGGIVTSQQGNRGGYVLTKEPTEITLREIVKSLEGETFEVFCEPDVRENITCTHHALCALKPVWQMTKDALDQLFSAITLEMLASGNIKRKPFRFI